LAAISNMEYRIIIILTICSENNDDSADVNWSRVTPRSYEQWGSAAPQHFWVWRWPNPVRDSGGQHDRRSAVISQVWGDARSGSFHPDQT
jgi:hypothetical protein